MNPEHRSARQYISDLSAAGRYFFTVEEAQRALGVSPDATKLALHRLSRKGEIASPARGFHVIVPPEYRALGCLPAEQFIPALMSELKSAYYVGLLSAAQYHGAAHHRPQEFQVMLDKPRRPIACGKVHVSFHLRRRLVNVPTQSFNTPRGAIVVSTPEATAFDLIGYENRLGGLDAVATILAELAEKLDPIRLGALAAVVPMSWVQRLGYILDRIDAAPKATSLRTFVHANARDFTALMPSADDDSSHRDETWKVIVNADVEAEA